MLCWSGLSKSGQIRDVLREFQGYHTNQANYKLGVMSPEYWLESHHSGIESTLVA